MWVPFPFFAIAPLATIAAGLLLLWPGSVPFATSWGPHTLTLTHLGTLGLLGGPMLGALYQMCPVVAGSPVPAPRLVPVVSASWALGLAALAAGLFLPHPAPVFVAVTLLTGALLGFAIPVGMALWRAPVSDEAVRGMRLAWSSLLLVALAGIWMAHGHAGMRFPGDRALWIRAHLLIGICGWVGGLISAVSIAVVPMFYLSPPTPARGQRTVRGLIAAGVAAQVVVLTGSVAGADLPWLSALGGLLAGGAVWGLFPALTIRALRDRKRRVADPSLRFWFAGLACAPAVGVCAIAAYLSADPRLGLLLGWLAIWGWAGAIIHGMLSRIVPFLVWLHWLSPLIGQRDVPPMAALWPESWGRWALTLHVAALGCGALAIWTGYAPLTRLTGALVLAVGVGLGAAMVQAVLRGRSHQPKGALSAVG